MDHIFQGYDQRIRPVKNDSRTVVLELEPNIVRLIEVNTQQEYIKLSLSLDQSWHDDFLTWNPADYNGTDEITVSMSALWLPDITIITTSFQSEQIIDADKQQVTVNSNGSVYLTYPFVLSNYCPMKTEEFPYDQQDCIIKVTSWRYPMSKIRLQPLSNETSYAQNNNSEWDILPITFEIMDLTYGNKLFRQIWYTFTIKRKPAYYVWVLIMPTFVITVLSIAGIFAPFNNTGERAEKMTLGLTTLLTLAVILSMVTGEMPRSTSLPLLGQFVLVEISIIVICMAISVVILFLHQRATTRPWPVPSWLEKFLAGDCLKIIGQKNETVSPLNCHPLSPGNTTYVKKKTNDFQCKVKEAASKESINYIGGSTTPFDDVIAQVKDCINKNEQETKAQADEEKRKEQWMILFDHLDLLLFVGFQVIHAVLYVTLYYRSF